MKTLVAIAALTASFLIGRFAGAVWFDVQADSPPAAPESRAVSPRLTALSTKPAPNHGNTVLLARRSGMSAQSIDLLEKLDLQIRDGGYHFNQALVSLDSARLDHLLEEVSSQRPRTPKLRQLEHLIRGRWAEVGTRRKAEGGNLQAIEALGRTDPVGAITLARSLGGHSRGDACAKEILASWSQRSPAEATDYLMENNLLTGQEFQSGYWAANLMRNWAKSDPAAAATFFASIPQSGAKSKALNELVKGWALSDPERAFAWLESQPGIDPDSLESAMADLVDIGSEVDPDFVLSLVNSDEGAHIRGRALSSLAEYYGRSDPASALDWLDTLDGYDDQSAATTGVLESIAAGDVESLDRIVRAAPPARKAQILDRFANRWAGNHPEEAIAWASSLDPRDRFAASEGLITALTSSDEGGSHHAELASFIEEEPTLHRTWSKYLASSWAQLDPATALEWSRELQWPAARQEASSGVVRIWAQSDPDAAEEAVRSTPGLDDALRDTLLEQIAE